MMCIPFDQYQRYKNTANIIEKVRQKESYRILEVGANEHKNLEKFLPNDQIYYLDIELPEHLINDPAYFLADATDLKMFNDNEFDYILAMDTFEHIPNDRRDFFVKELTRVGRHVIIAGPFSSDNQEVELTELRLNNYYKALFDYDFRWLIEHIDNGLPSMRKTCDLLDELGHQYLIFQHGDIELWEKMFRIHFLNESTKGKYKYYKDYADTYYIEKCFSNDFSSKCYRSFLLINIPVTEENIPKSSGLLECSVIERILEDFERLWEKENFRYKEPLTVSEEHFLQIFELNDNGYDEAHSTMIQGLTEGTQTVEIDKFVSGLRLDFGNTMCQIVLGKIEVYEDKFKLIPTTIDIANGFKVGNCFVFYNDDPQILLRFERECKVSQIVLDYKYLVYKDEEIRDSIKIISDHVIDLHESQRSLHNENINLNSEMIYYKQELERLEKTIQESVTYIDEANNNYRELASNYQRLEGEYNGFVRLLKLEKEHSQQLTENIKTLETQLNFNQTQVQELNSEKLKLMDLNKDLNFENLKLIDSSKDLSLENIKLIDSNKDLSLQNIKLIDSGENLLQDIKKLRDINEEYQNEITWLKNRKWWHVLFNVKRR